MEREIECKTIVDILYSNHYPEINHDSIRVKVVAKDDPSKSVAIAQHTYMGPIFLFTNVYVEISHKAAESDGLTSIVCGIIGHEFAHIVLGHLSDPRPPILALMGNYSLLKTAENQADDEAIKRNLGNDLLAARVYREELCGSKPANQVIYSSDEIKAKLEMR